MALRGTYPELHEGFIEFDVPIEEVSKLSLSPIYIFLVDISGFSRKIIDCILSLI